MARRSLIGSFVREMGKSSNRDTADRRRRQRMREAVQCRALERESANRGRPACAPIAKPSVTASLTSESAMSKAFSGQKLSQGTDNMWLPVDELALVSRAKLER
jgi:hypothetical protein